MCVTVDGFVVGKIIKTANFNFAPAKYAQTTQSIAELDITTTSLINAWITPNEEWDADDLVGYSVIAEPKENTIDFHIFGTAPIVGKFNINYFWS
jgi:hypothetical protein